MTQEVLQSLPVTRQRHSLLAVGKNLLNIPDDDPRTATLTNTGVTTSSMAMTIVSPPQKQLQQVTLMSSPKPPVPIPSPLAYELCKPFKKRVLPDTGFGFTNESAHSCISMGNGNGMSTQRNAKLPRTVSAENVAMASTALIVAQNNLSKQNDVTNEENRENIPENIYNNCGASSLMDLSKACEVERTKIEPANVARSSNSQQVMKTPSPNYFGSSRSLLRNSPINLSMDRRNAHIISPLALTTHNRSSGFAVRVRPASHIIPPSPTNTTPSGLYRKPSAPSPLMNSASRYIRLSPTMTVRRSPLRGPQQSPILAMRKPFSPTSLLTLNNHQDLIPNGPQQANGQRIKVLRIASQDSGTNGCTSVTGNTTNNMKLVGLNNGKGVIALVSNTNNLIASGNTEATTSLCNGAVSEIATRRILSPKSSAINLIQRSPGMYRLSRFTSN